MVFEYNTEKLETALLDFYNATGINIIFHDANIVPVIKIQQHSPGYCKLIQESEHGLVSCHRSDRMLLDKCRMTRKAQMHICHAGLIDIAVPLIYNDIIIGYILLGQLRKDKDYSNAKLFSELGIDSKKAEAYYKELVQYDDKRIESIMRLAVMLTRYILLENILKPKVNSSVEFISDYINSNLEKKLNVKDIAKAVHCSPSVIYKNFHTCLGCTLGEYITNKRIEKSCQLLQSTTLSVEEISQAVGFSSAAYYSRMFKKLKGISPSKFRAIP